VTTDLHDLVLPCSQVTTDLHDDCTLEFQGTSSAAPLAAGCIALVLEAKYAVFIVV